MDHFMVDDEDGEENGHHNNIIRIIEHPIKDWMNPLEAYSNVKFKRKFRFEKEVVRNVLLPLVGDSLESHSGKYLSPLIQLMVALRFFASNSFQNIVGDTVTVSQPSICRIVNKVSRLFAGMYQRFVHFPTEDEAPNIKQQFFQIAGVPGYKKFIKNYTKNTFKDL